MSLACVPQVLTVDQGRVGACRQVLVSDPGLGPVWGLLPGLSDASAPHSPLHSGLIDACRECGARALGLVGQLQDQQAVQQAQPGLVRTPLQGILQLAQVRDAAKVPGMGWALLGDNGSGVGFGSPTSLYLPAVWAEPMPGSSTPTPESCCPSLLPRCSVGWLGVECSLSDPWLPSSSRS